MFHFDFGATFKEYTKHQEYRTINRSYIPVLYTQPSSKEISILLIMLQFS